ncbi:hypothetical protein BC827DRAFT_1269618 [Russula dissimulans]|nr:hypothetical protein BC827DRAFT_1269618 [Russula dissimulans]
MSPSTLQARIKAFEALGTGASKQVLESVAIQPEPEHLLDRPHSPTIASIPPMLPTTYSPSASPSSLGHRSSLVDLKDWVIDDGPFHVSSTTTTLSSYSPPQAVKLLPHERVPLISFEGSPPKSINAPPLPPRRSSFNAPRSVSAPASSPTLPPRASPSSHNMLIPPDADHPYLPTLTDLSLSNGMRRAQGHVQASSISSFHSVSLSSDGDDSAIPGALHAFSMERETGTEDGESLDESFENVSAPSSFLPPITLPPRPQKPPGKPALAVATAKRPTTPQPPPQPPKLPQRPVPPPRDSVSSFGSQGSSPSPILSGVSSPALTRIPSSSSSPPSLLSTRRPAPPPPIPPAAAAFPSPPPRSRTSVQSTATTGSDRSSLFSQSTATSRTSTSSRASAMASAPAPAPAGAKQALASRARYDVLFLANVRAHTPKPSPPTPGKRQNAGWRGLSIDIDSGAGNAPVSALPVSESGSDAKLDGRVVREIWLKSRLESERLWDIWNECDRDGTGSLDRDAFARGMARIDEELRRAQVLGRARASSGLSVRAPRPVPSRPILR